MRKKHVKFDPEEELFGDVNTMLRPDEKWVWIALRMFCACCPHQPFICTGDYRNHIPLLDKQIAQYLKVPHATWLRSKEKLLEMRLIEVDPQNILTIVNWHRWQPSTWQKAYEKKKQKFLNREKEMANEAEKQKLRTNVLNYFHSKTGRRYKPSSSYNIRYIDERAEEGATYEDFVYVIDLKTKDWLGIENLEHLLSPPILFSKKNFWKYRSTNEIQKNT